MTKSIGRSKVGKSSGPGKSSTLEAVAGASAGGAVLGARLKRQYAKVMGTYQVAFDKGDRRALANAIRYCALVYMPLPGWAAVAWLKAYQDIFTTFKVASWHELLANSVPLTPKALTRERLKIRQRGQVARYAHRDAPIGRETDEGLFKVIADLTGLTSRQVKSRFYELPSEYRRPTRSTKRSK
jgi:hypothetical protein